MSAIEVPFTVFEHGKGLPAPFQATAGAAGLDLSAAVPAHEPMIIAPGDHDIVPTGFALGLPDGYEAQIRPRSGLAAKHAVTTLNAPGTIDADYRGEVHVILINHGKQDFVINRGDRIAQMVIAPVPRIAMIETNSLDKTDRGAGGFGSTGVST
ncbi:dUTP diphosphatase [Maritalea sp.]|uniref:dUTP diphosphatase n=1 Tax=Maritalea sp. TaxID=2003361 RepID=UPI003EF29499